MPRRRNFEPVREASPPRRGETPRQYMERADAVRQASINAQKSRYFNRIPSPADSADERESNDLQDGDDDNVDEEGDHGDGSPRRRRRARQQSPLQAHHVGLRCDEPQLIYYGIQPRPQYPKLKPAPMPEMKGPFWETTFKAIFGTELADYHRRKESGMDPKYWTGVFKPPTQPGEEAQSSEDSKTMNGGSSNQERHAPPRATVEKHVATMAAARPQPPASTDGVQSQSPTPAWARHLRGWDRLSQAAKDDLVRRRAQLEISLRSGGIRAVNAVRQQMALPRPQTTNDNQRRSPSPEWARRVPDWASFSQAERVSFLERSKAQLAAMADMFASSSRPQKRTRDEDAAADDGEQAERPRKRRRVQDDEDIGQEVSTLADGGRGRKRVREPKEEQDGGRSTKKAKATDAASSGSGDANTAASSGKKRSRNDDEGDGEGEGKGEGEDVVRPKRRKIAEARPTATKARQTSRQRTAGPTQRSPQSVSKSSPAQDPNSAPKESQKPQTLVRPAVSAIAALESTRQTRSRQDAVLMELDDRGTAVVQRPRRSPRNKSTNKRAEKLDTPSENNPSLAQAKSTRSRKATLVAADSIEKRKKTISRAKK